MRSALHWAVHWEDGEATDLLIRGGANVNAANELGVTPLLMAAASGKERKRYILEIIEF